MRTIAVAALLLTTAPVAAQSLDSVQVERRVSRLEGEMRAVQRKVFPGGDPRYFEPEILPPETAAPGAVDTAAANQPLIDLTARVDEMERQLRTLTGQVEAQGYRLKQIEEAQAKLRGDLEFRLNTLEGNGTAPAGIGGTAPAGVGATAAPLGAPPTAAPTAPPRSTPAAGPKSGAAGNGTSASATATPAPAATADAAWKLAYARVLAKDWPATETAMTDFIADWPKSTRLAQAQYWLGRSHAERAQHAQAARAFLDVYQKYPRSDQAPGALLGLATAMNGLKKPTDACRVLGELDSVYGARLTPSQQTDAKALRAKAKCPA